jgi:hypothetical protein
MTYLRCENIKFLNLIDSPDYSFTCTLIDTEFTEEIFVQKEDATYLRPYNFRPLDGTLYFRDLVPVAAIIQLFSSKNLNVEGNLLIYLDHFSKVSKIHMDECIVWFQYAVPMWKKVNETKLKKLRIFL